MKANQRRACGLVSLLTARVLQLPVVALLLLLPSKAFAEEPTPAESPARWYGWQTLAVDGGALALGASGLGFAGADHQSLGIATGGIAITAAVVGGPIVHFVHRRVGAGLGSLALRVGLPLVGAGLGGAIATSGEGECKIDGGCPFIEMTAGAVIGGLAAMATDAAVLAYDSVPPPESPAQPRQFTAVPTLSVGAGKFMFGAVGSF